MVREFKLLEKLRKDGIAKCPECEKGYIHPQGDRQITSFFYCDTCKFRIELNYKLPE